MRDRKEEYTERWKYTWGVSIDMRLMAMINKQLKWRFMEIASGGVNLIPNRSDAGVPRHSSMVWEGNSEF